MKRTGIVRRIDDLGRVVIPKEICRTLGIAEGDPLEIAIEGHRVVLNKYETGCKLCGNSNDISRIRGNLICKACVSEIAEARGA